MTIRPAIAEDAPVIAEFNRRLARETEGRELDADTYAVLLHLSEKVFLLISPELVLAGDQMHFHITSFIHRLEYGFEEVHQVLGLVEVPYVGIRHYDFRRASQVRSKQVVKTHAFLILLNLDMTFARNFRRWRRRDCWFLRRFLRKLRY